MERGYAMSCDEGERDDTYRLRRFVWAVAETLIAPPLHAAQNNWLNVREMEQPQ